MVQCTTLFSNSHAPSAEEDRNRDVLHEIAGTPVDRVAIAPLVQRAQRNADQRHAGGKPAPARIAAHRPIVQDQHDAGEPEQQSGPLHRRDPLAEPAVGEGRGQDRLQARDQRGQPGGNRMRDRDRGAAEIKSVHQNARDGAVEDADPIRPWGRTIATMTAIRTTTSAIRIAR